ncbi:MAG: alpha/beta hydrolase [Deltaproteobacteria bacterium]|nr:alpha/beta hydrolase [Deltaproteobacteria bacterium]
MTKTTRSHIDDLRGASRLAVEATRGVAALVEKMHVAIASGPAMLGRPLAGPVRLATGVVYGSIDGIAKLVGAGLDASLAQLAPLVKASEPSAAREAVQAVVNGVLGDYLHETANPLAIEMELRRRTVDATAKLVVLVHGSCMTDAQFTRGGHDHGAALARDLGYTPVYLRYNSGRHISTNGRAFAAQLEALVASWPVAVAELVLIGHSMGGLVARSACHVAAADGLAWPAKLRALITLGTPHHGAPLERGGNWFEQLLDLSPYSAPLGVLGRIRSAGVTDLRFGNVLDEHWQGRDRFERGTDTRTPCPLPAGVRCYALAGTLSAEDGPHLRGDGLVPVDSALGKHARPELCLAFPAAQCRIAFGTGHVDLLGASVYPTLHGWLAA